MAKKKRAELKTAPSLDELIRLATRTQERLRKDGIELQWTLSWVPCEPKKSPL